jgi:hypothetical protein
MVFSSQLAHDLTLRIESPVGAKSAPIELPVTADPSRGGLVLKEPAPSLPPGELIGVIHGKWGFDDWTGPQFHLLSPQPGSWTLAAIDQSALVVGREDILHFDGQDSLCIDKVEEQSAQEKSKALAWMSPKPEALQVSVPMKDAAPGPVTIAIYQYGIEKPEAIQMTAFADAASLDRLTMSAGDSDGLLKGTRLDEVARAELDGIALKPLTLSRVEDHDQLLMQADSSTARLDPGKRYTARVELKDGRMLRAPVTVDPPRPQMALLSKGVQEDNAAAPSPVQLGNPDDLPLDGRLVFFLKSTVPARFPRNEKVELAAVDGSFDTELSLADGSLMLEDARTAMGNLEPLNRLGASAFGPIHIRALSAEGAAGDWLPLGTLVRVPGFKELRCPHSAARPCVLTGSNLFLVGSIAATPDFENPTDVLPEFTGTQLAVPHPANGTLYIRLRDDPATVQTLSLPVTLVTPAASESAAARNRPQTAQPAEPSAPDSAAPASAAPATTPAEAHPDSGRADLSAVPQTDSTPKK